MNKIKEMFRSAHSRYGTLSTLFTVIVIAIVLLINMVVGQLPDKWKSIDLSTNNLYEITDQSKELLKGLDKEVQLHILASKDSIDERIKLFVEKYAGLSKKVSVKWTDPELHPTVLTSNNAESNTIIVSCADTGKSTKIALSDIITYNEMYMYYYGTEVEEGFDAEGQLTSAINHVVNDTAQKIYCTTGHGEVTIGSSLADLMKKSNYTAEEINTLMVTAIPEDCDLLFFYAPVTDLTEAEKTMISTYMQGGGDVILVLGDGTKATPNLDSLMVEYGMQITKGYVADPSRSLQQNYEYVIPVLSLSGEMASGIQSEMVLLVYPRGMKTVTPARDTISVEEFMKTSENGVAVWGETAQEQASGTYVLGAVATENESRFTVITSHSMIDDALTKAYGALENNTLFMNAVTSNFDSASNVAIEPKSLNVEQNMVQHAGVYSLVAIFAIPIIVLLYGFVTWMRRRKA